MRTSLPVLFVLLAAWAPRTAAAAGLTIEEATAIAEQRSPTVREAAAGVEQTAGERDRASALTPANPELEVSFRSDRLFRNQGEWGLDVGLSQEVELFGQRGLRIRVADGEVSVARLELAAARLRAKAEAALAYVELVFQERRVEALSAVVELATRLEQAGRRRLAAGDLAESEVTLLEADLVAARADLRAAEAERAAARARLNALLGRAVGEATATTGAFPALRPAAALDLLVELARERRPELAAARRELEARGDQVELARRERLPNPIIGVGYAFDRVSLGGDDFVPPGVVGGAVDGDHFLGVTLTLPLPIFRTGSGEVRSAQGARAAASARVDGLLAAIEAEVAAARARYEQARVAAEEYAAIEAKLGETLARYEQAYVDGKVELAQFLAVRDRVLRATLAALETRHAAAVSALELELAVGGDFTGDGR